MTTMDAICLFSVLIDVVIASRFMVPHHIPSSTPIRVLVLVVLITPVKSYLKWQTIQLVIHSIISA